MKRIFLLSIFLVCAFAGAEKHVTILNANQFAVYPQYPLGDYGIIENRFFDVSPAFLECLKKSKLLYIGQTTNPDLIFEKEEYRQAVEDFLRKGGKIWFEYFTFGRPVTTKWLKEINVNLPSQDTSNQGTISGIPATDIDHPILKTPNDVSGYSGKGHFCWKNWKKDFIGVLRLKNDPVAATMLVKENVLEKGRIIFNCIWALATTDYAGTGFYGTGQKLLMNILSFCFGEPITESKIVTLFKRFQTNKDLAVWIKNPYFPLADCPQDAPEKMKLERISVKACINEDISSMILLTSSSSSKPLEIVFKK